MKTPLLSLLRPARGQWFQEAKRFRNEPKAYLVSFCLGPHLVDSTKHMIIEGFQRVNY
jgi:hypothetical protein